MEVAVPPTSRRLLPRALPVLLPALACAACAPVTGQVKFDSPASCSENAPASPEDLPAGPSQADLQCALAGIRQVVIPTPTQDLLAARLAGELAAGEPDVKRMEKLAAEGQWWAERAMFHLQEDPAALYWYAMNMGQLLLHHPLRALKNLGRMERSLKKAAAGVPDLDGGGPLRVLGVLYVKAPAWPQGIGDADKGLDLLKQAVERHPEHPMNAYFLARALWDVDGDSVRDEVAANLAAARKALAAREWGWVSRRWQRDIDALAKEAGVPDEAGVPQPPDAVPAG